MGRQLLTPNFIAIGYKGNSSSAFKFAKEWPEEIDLAQSCLHKATKQRKKFADKNRRPAEYQVGDLVLVKLHLLQKTGSQLHKGLLRCYEGPFRIIKRVEKVAYKLELPPKFKYHLVFHVSMLELCYENMDNPERTTSHRARNSSHTRSGS